MKVTRRIILAVTAGLLTVGTIASVPSPSYATINGINKLVSYDYTNTNPVGGSYAAISDDGNFVAFMSANTNVVSGDTNGATDVFLRDLQTNTTDLVDQSTAGVQTVAGVYTLNGQNDIAISRTGQYVLFTSRDAHLIDGQTISGGIIHVYLRNTVLNTTTLVDTTTSGTIGNDNALVGGVSDDGRFVVFLSHATNLGGGTNGLTYLYMKDMSTNTLQVLSHSASGTNANNAIGAVSVSCDGSLVVFSSPATNLTPSNNGYTSTYLIDLRNGFSITNLTLAANNTTYPNTMSCNGRYIYLVSTATNLTSDSVDGIASHRFRYDRLTSRYVLVDQSTSGSISSNGSGTLEYAGRTISDNGMALFTTSDKNIVSPASTSFYQVYLRSPEAGTTELVAINSSGNEATPVPAGLRTMSISSDGKSIISTSKATNLIPGITTVGTGGEGNIVLSEVQ